MGFKVIRSTLIMPVHIPQFVEKAHMRGADAIMLDLEDSVPHAEKSEARKLIRESLSMIARGGTFTSVRVNNDPLLLADDLEASIFPGLESVCLPKIETAEEVSRIDKLVGELERKRGIESGRIKFSVVIETPLGLLNIQKITSASPRIETMGIGPEDYCRELGVEPSPEGTELAFPVAFLVTVCKAKGIRPVGLVGSIAGFSSALEGFEKAAKKARQLGCEGAACIHPAQVPILNEVFSPGVDKIEAARSIVKAFEEGEKQGKASVNWEGRMIDIPVYTRALRVIQIAGAVAEQERRRAQALARLK